MCHCDQVRVVRIGGEDWVHYVGRSVYETDNVVVGKLPNGMWARLIITWHHTREGAMFDSDQAAIPAECLKMAMGAF